ncbi:ABC transporter permease [Hungatella hathewayi]|uniref:ABC transporter permease n=1 Tax=Hungatella hathewayi TaxID=154046 RepID=UPI0006C16592|nr:ABC transporter permease subunit [Hungatella hathewayi]CUQ50757.1 protein LplB [Hungatella hathewayi]
MGKGVKLIMKKEGVMHELRKNRTLFLMILPAVLIVLVFSYIPLNGLVLAFKDFRYAKGIWGSPWNGLENFRFLFASGKGWQLTRNTILYNVVNLLISQGLALVVAIVLSEMRGRRFKKTTQSIIFLPYFISWIIVGAFVQNIFNYETGTLNNLLTKFGMDPINMYAIPAAWILVIIFFNSWKWVGYNSVIYIAAVAGLDRECFEATDIDGANIWQKIRYITIPGIKPTLIIIFLLNLGKVLRGDFQMFYQIIGMNGQLYDITDVIDTYVFRSLLSGTDMGMTAAATLYQSVMCFVIINIANAVVKKIDPDYALF